MSALFNTLPSWAAGGMVMFIFVFLKAFQQRNVAFDSKWYWILGTSYGMVFAEAFIVVTFITVGYHVPTILGIGTGAGFGAILAMHVHRRIFGVQKK